MALVKKSDFHYNEQIHCADLWGDRVRWKNVEPGCGSVTAVVTVSEFQLGDV